MSEIMCIQEKWCFIWNNLGQFHVERREKGDLTKCRMNLGGGEGFM